jgi:hypothetical protein
MTLLWAFFLAAAPPPSSAGKTVDVPAARQEIIYRVPVTGSPMLLEAAWSSNHPVSLVLLEESQFRLRRRGEAHTPIAFGDFITQGTLNGWLPGGATYLVVIDNRMNARQPARVELKVKWQRAGQARYPDPGRARILVFGSAGLFLGLCVFAGARLRHGIEDNRRI